MSDQAKLLAARAFIQDKQFDVARTILEQLPDNPAAKTWLTQLNKRTGATVTPPKVSDLKSDQLVNQITDDEAFRELLFRAAQNPVNVEVLIDLIFPGTEFPFGKPQTELWAALARGIAEATQYPILERLCQVVTLLSIEHDDDPIFEHLIGRLRSDDLLIRKTAAQPLWKMNLPAARRALLAYPPLADHEARGITITESANEGGALKRYRAIQGGIELFNMAIVREENRYRLTYPGRHKLDHHFHVVDVIYSMAERDIQSLIAREQMRHDTIDEDAPYQ